MYQTEEQFYHVFNIGTVLSHIIWLLYSKQILKYKMKTKKIRNQGIISHQQLYPAGTCRRKNVELTSIRRNDYASTSVRRHSDVMCPQDMTSLWHGWFKLLLKLRSSTFAICLTCSQNVWEIGLKYPIFKPSPWSLYLRYVKERNFISIRAFVPILIVVSCVYIYICIEKFK